MGIEEKTSVLDSGKDASVDTARSSASAEKETSIDEPGEKASTRATREEGLAKDAKQEVAAKIERYTALAQQASVEKSAKLEREGKGEVLEKASAEETAEGLLEEKVGKKEANAKT